MLSIARAALAVAIVTGLTANPAVSDDSPASGVRSFIDAHCLDCHNSEDPDGGLDLTSLRWTIDKPANFASWVDVHDRVRNGEMPPEDADAPSKTNRDSFTSAIGAALHRHGVEKQQREGRTVLRRLNRVEYENSINELLGVDVSIKPLLPEDASTDGFDTVASGLRFSAVQIEKYLEAIDVALDAAVRLTQRPKAINSRYSYKDEREVRKNLDTPEGKVDKASGQRHRHLFRETKDAVVFISHGYSPDHLRQFAPTADGVYRVRISAYGHMSKGKPVAIQIFSSDWKVERLIGYFELPPDKPRVVQFDVRLRVNEHLRVAGYGIGIDENGKSLWNIDSVKGWSVPGMAVQWIEVEGPLLQQWPPPSVERLFGKQSIRKLDRRGKWTPRGHLAYELAPEDPHEAARRAVERFAERAFRRPLKSGEADRFVKLAHAQLDAGGSYENAVRVAVRGILVSPRFLVLDESPGKLDDYALASRLSYFLWSSTPDEQLLSLAAEGRLSDDEVLRQQAGRMIDSPKFDQFITNFVGQWLDLRQIGATSPDMRLYPEYDHLLRNSMLAETEAFIKELISNDLPVNNIIDSRFAMLDRRLAAHYDIALKRGQDSLLEDRAVFGEQFRRVSLPDDSPRGGVLTQAAVLKVTANGTVTSPVLRGAWVLRRILGTPPSPPPPVDAIEPDTRGATTIREQLAKHRNSETCNSCHRVIDPPGFALESFDVIGGFRDRYRSDKEGDPATKKLHGRNIWEYKLGQPVDASGQTSDGKPFKGIRQFKQLLMAKQDQVLRCLTENLVTYATGAGVTFCDRVEVERITANVKKNGGGFRTLMLEIVASPLFRRK